MRALPILLTIVTLLVSSCTQIPIKVAPEHSGVDPKIQPLVDEFMWLSTQKNITFNRKVTIGFKKINRGDVIGLCTYGGLFREIDIDLTYWNNATKASRMALLYHELTHCYCSRNHDYGKDKVYPETEAARIARALLWKVEGGDRPGYYDDGCPTSIMHPTLLDDDCIHAHYDTYTQEMFDRCRSW